MVTVGTTLSNVIVLSTLVDAWLALFAASVGFSLLNPNSSHARSS